MKENINVSFICKFLVVSLSVIPCILKQLFVKSHIAEKCL